jgi:L-malate glycosyltransferase
MRDPSKALLVAVVLVIRSPWSVLIAKSLAELGVQVTVVAFEESGRDLNEEQLSIADEGRRRLEEAGATIRWISPHGSGVVKFARLVATLRALHVEGANDICLTLYGGAFGAAALLSGFRPYAVFWVGSDIRLVTGAKRFISSLVARFAALNLANGAALAEYGETLFAPTKMVTFYHGIDCDRFTIGDAAASRDGVSLICTRSFEPVYDNATVLEAFVGVRRVVPKAHAIFAAGGSLKTAVEKRWRALAAGDDESAVRFIGGAPNATLVELLKISDIYVSMSLSDGTSTSMLEAFAAELYPIMSDIPANREWIDTHGCMGALVPVGDVKALENAIVDAMTNPDKRVEATRRNLEIVRRLASIKTNLKVLKAELAARARA